MATIKIKVRKGYVLFVNNRDYPEGSILEVEEKDVADQKWKYEKIKIEPETKTVNEDIAEDRMIKEQDTKKKGFKK